MNSWEFVVHTRAASACAQEYHVPSGANQASAKIAAERAGSDNQGAHSLFLAR
jgi:hypothetical protein